MPVLKNARHERFAQELAKGKSQTAAYKAAGYKGGRSSAAHLATKSNISIRVAEIQGQVAEKTEVTIETLGLQLDEDRRFARALEHSAVALNATLGKAKLYGLIDQKGETPPTVVNNFVTVQGIAKEVDELFREPPKLVSVGRVIEHQDSAVSEFEEQPEYVDVVGAE